MIAEDSDGSESRLNLWNVCFDHSPQQVWLIRDRIDSTLLTYGPELPFVNCGDDQWMFTERGLILAYARVLESSSDPKLRAEAYDYVDGYLPLVNGDIVIE